MRCWVQEKGNQDAEPASCCEKPIAHYIAYRFLDVTGCLPDRLHATSRDRARSRSKSENPLGAPSRLCTKGDYDSVIAVPPRLRVVDSELFTVRTAMGIVHVAVPKGAGQLPTDATACYAQLQLKPLHLPADKKALHTDRLNLVSQALANINAPSPSD